MASRGKKTKSTGQKDILLGRQAEMDLILHRLEEARAGKGCFLAISGEPGIGKTRLAQAATIAAKKKGFHVSWGQCHDGQYIPPYWPWKQLLRDTLGLLPQRASAQSRGILNALSEIVASAPRDHSRTPEMPKPISQKARLKILESATLLVRMISENDPVLLVLDNLHCADVPSLQLLQVMSSETSGCPVVIIGSYREPSALAGGAFREIIGALAGQSFFESIPLAGWDASGVQECLIQHGIENPPLQLTRAVFERTNGNPLFVLEVVRLLRQRGLLDSLSGARPWETLIPQKVRLAILGLFERLTAPCKNALAAAALVGREFESRFLQEVAGEDGSSIEPLFEEALAHGLIQGIDERPGFFRFVHALVQDVIREETPVLRRPLLHVKIAEASERRLGKDLEAHAGELARHFQAAGGNHAEKAIHYYSIAGENALRMCAYEDAHEQITRALHLAGGDILPSKMARLLFGMGQSLHGLGRVMEAAECHARAFALFVKSGEIDNAVQIFEQPLILMEKPANLTKVLEEAISLVGWSSLRGEALGGKYGLAVYHDTGDYSRAAAIFEKAVRSARASGDVQQEMTALTNWGRIEADQLQFETALSIEKDAMRVATENGELWIEAIVHITSALASLGLGRIQEGENQARLLSALAGRLQTGLWNAISSVLSSAIHRQKGELRSAFDVTDRAIASGEPSFLVLNQAIRTLLQYEIGEADAAKELLQKVIAGANQAVRPFHWEGLLAVLIPFVAWATGDAVPLEIAERAAGEVPLYGGLRRGDAVTVSLGLGLIAAIRKDRESARRHYEELLPFRGLVAHPYLGLATDHVLGILAWTVGDTAEARTHFDSAVDFCRANGLRIELAYTCRDYAEFLLQVAGKAEQQKILHLCREAIPIAEASGLVHLTGRLAQVRDAAGHGKPGRPEFPDSLSEREVDVLRLISQGLSNAQIGERLFISLHTVANHVQSILEKTGAANRTEAAAYAIHHHLTSD